MMRRKVSRLDGVLLDMDGVLFHGDRPLPHAIPFLREISSFPYLLVTNNPSRTPQEVARRMRKMGFEEISPAHILTSAEASAEWLARQKPAFRYFAVGAAGLHAALS
ncbi:MAG TPA: haloacid dehalogenase, partial [Chromatiales bacterium]|nr:haloacid dehalogenase [Chromatiales bacterium]